LEGLETFCDRKGFQKLKIYATENIPKAKSSKISTIEKISKSKIPK
jgi:hypothetical protein